MGEPDWPFGGRPKPERLWSLWLAGSLLEATINTHPRGHEVRVYVGGGFLYAFVRPTRELAEAEADEQKRERLAEGWTDRPLSTIS